MTLGKNIYPPGRSFKQFLNVPFILATIVYFGLFFALAFLLIHLLPEAGASIKQAVLYMFLVNVIPLLVGWFIYYILRPKAERPKPPRNLRAWLLLIGRMAVALFVYLLVLYMLWWAAGFTAQFCHAFRETAATNPYLINCRVMNWLGEGEIVVRMLLMPQNPIIISLIPLGVFWAALSITKRHVATQTQSPWRAYLTSLMAANVLAILPWITLLVVVWRARLTDSLTGFEGFFILPYLIFGFIVASLNVFSIPLFLWLQKPVWRVTIVMMLLVLASIIYTIWLAITWLPQFA